jgi:hypothetical protein
VYRKGLFDIIEACNVRGMSGQFGDTVLRTYTLCGRIMMTFAKSTEKDLIGDNSVTFITEEGDPLAYSAGIQTIEADFRTSLDLIEDVIKYWPEVQKAGTFKAKASISFL